MAVCLTYGNRNVINNAEGEIRKKNNIIELS